MTDIDGGPTGRFGFRRLTDFGPFVTQDELYHATTGNVTEVILEHGFIADRDEYVELYQDAIEVAGRDADKELSHIGDKVIDVIGDVVGNRPEGVTRTNANYFFADTDSAVEFANSRIISDIIVVDRNKIPCRGYSSDINNALPAFQAAASGDVIELPTPKPERSGVPQYEINKEDVPDDLLEQLRDYWDTVSLYDGSVEYGLEVFYNCDIPPEAIKGVVEV